MARRTSRALLVTVAAVIGAAALVPTAIGGGTADAAPSASAAAAARPDDLATDLAALTRSTPWTQLTALDLDFPTFHTQGLVATADRFYPSSVEILEPTVAHPTPVDGYDRTPGKGVGHLFVIDRAGHLVEDIVLGHGDVYHPGGIALHGNDLWVPVSEYRPNSAAEVYRIDVRTLAVTRQFSVADHIGTLIWDASTGELVAGTWGSRTFYELTPAGKTIRTWDNPQYMLDFQDCQYVVTGKMACAGITNLPQMPGVTAPRPVYELGGIALLDLRKKTVISMVPFQQFSNDGHVMTRNPVAFAAEGNVLTMWTAPDDGEDATGTEIHTWQATLPPRR